MFFLSVVAYSLLHHKLLSCIEPMIVSKFRYSEYTFSSFLFARFSLNIMFCLKQLNLYTICIMYKYNIV